jgi:hypothetical protein
MLWYGIAAILIMLGGSGAAPATGSEEPMPAVPGFNERLNQALGAEGGVQVYQDSAGMSARSSILPGVSVSLPFNRRRVRG